MKPWLAQCGLRRDNSRHQIPAGPKFLSIAKSRTDILKTVKRWVNSKRISKEKLQRCSVLPLARQEGGGVNQRRTLLVRPAQQGGVSVVARCLSKKMPGIN